MTQWKFPEKTPDQKARNPISDEFFDSPEVLTDVSALVRESIQNSIDARHDPDSPVLVRLKLGELSSSHATPFLDGLQPHLDSVYGVEKAPQAHGPIRYIAIEDFNTSGLTGDTSRSSVAAGEESDSSYTYFIHIEGDSPKGEGKKGKWGVGKVVFQRISELKTFFVFSSRAPHPNDGVEDLWIGQSILKFHQVGDKTLQPDGWFANQGTDGTFLPFKNEEARAFASTWGLSRAGEPGLSVVIPKIPKGLKIETVRDAILREYFIPILHGDLVCELIDLDGNSQIFRAENLNEVAQGLEMEKAVLADRSSQEITAAISLVTHAVANSVNDYSLEIPASLGSISDLQLDDAAVTQLRESFEASEPLRLTVKVHVPLPDSQVLVTDTFQVLLNKSPIQKSVTFYAREGILVPGRRNARLNHCVSLAVVEAGPLANLLGAAEGPAHDSWSAGTEKFKAKFGTSTKASRLIPIVRGLAEKVLQLISSQSGSFDNHILDEFFRIPDRSQSPNPSTAPPRPVPHPPRVPSLPPTSSIANVKAVDGGFQVYETSDLDLSGRTLGIKVAYEVNRGNAFSKYSTLDFDLSSMPVTVIGAKIVRKANNEIFAEILGSEFSITAEGFDPLRDLEVSFQLMKISGKSSGANA